MDDQTPLNEDLGRSDDSVEQADALIGPLYNELRAIAGSYLKQERADHTLQPTALVHEAYGRLADQTKVPWTNAAHFRAIAARVMRQVLVDHARKHNAAKRGGGAARVTLSGVGEAAEADPIDMLELDEALAALSGLHERKARVVELLYFGGMTHAEAGSLLGVSRKTVEADWYFARAWLGSRLREA
ncbi:MAG: ECF-type sigma factor [Planctomycetota bacterium]